MGSWQSLDYVVEKTSVTGCFSPPLIFVAPQPFSPFGANTCTGTRPSIFYERFHQVHELRYNLQLTSLRRTLMVYQVVHRTRAVDEPRDTSTERLLDDTVPAKLFLTSWSLNSLSPTLIVSHPKQIRVVKDNIETIFSVSGMEHD